MIIVENAQLRDPAVLNALSQARTPFVLTIDGPSRVSRTRAQALLASPVQAVSSIAVIPTTPTAIRRVFDVPEVRPNMVRQMTRAKVRYRAVEGAQVLDGSETGAFRTHLLREIGAGDQNDLFVLIGHNDGTHFRGSDGSRIPLADVSRALDARHRTGVVISCETAGCLTRAPGGTEIVTTQRLDPEELAAALALAQSRLRVYPKANFSDFVIEFGRALENTHAVPAGSTIKLIAVPVGAALIIVTLYVVVNR